MVKKDNPAGRLHAILTQARNQGNVPTIEVWTKVFGAHTGNKTEIMRNMSKLMELLDEIKAKISKMEGINTELYLSRFPEIEAVVKATNYDAGWDGYKAHLNDAAMLNLAHCAEVLSKYDENPVDGDELSELLKSVDELSEQVWKGNLDEKLKWVVTDLLEALRRSIREYRIRGAEGLRRDLAFCVGMLVQNHALFKANEEKEEVSRFGKIISKLNAIVSFALKLKELGIDLNSISGFIENHKG